MFCNTLTTAYIVTVDAHNEECFFVKVETVGTKLGKRFLAIIVLIIIHIFQDCFLKLLMVDFWMSM